MDRYTELEGLRVAVADMTRFTKQYRGKVLDIEDGETRGRVKCAIEELGWFTMQESPWCEPIYRGGSLMVPQAGDYVLVGFLAGDKARPYWDGLIGEIKSQQATQYTGTSKQILYARGDQSVIYDTEAGTLTVKGFETVVDGDNINLKTNGGTLVTDSSGGVELNGNSKRLVTYAELNTALGLFKTSIDLALAGAIVGHTHAVTTAPGTTAVGVGSAPATSLDISASQTTTIKTGG
jgi:hypothetical protein